MDDFHRLVGVDHFVLYDNGSSDDPEAVLEPCLRRDCHARPWPVPFHVRAAPAPTPIVCIAFAAARAGSTCLDIDEFLFAPRRLSLIPYWEVRAAPGIVVRWQVYGSSGQKRASDRPVIARFPRRAATHWIRNRRIKSIVDPARTLRAVGAHHFALKTGTWPSTRQARG